MRGREEERREEIEENKKKTETEWSLDGAFCRRKGRRQGRKSNELQGELHSTSEFFTQEAEPSLSKQKK